MSSKKGKKSEKQNKTPEVIQIEERPTEKEIVTGKGLFESDWTQTVLEENDLLFICGLVEEVYEKSHSILLHKATEKETFSFSVEWARQLLIDKIMCYFIEHDEGESSLGVSKIGNFCCKMEDSEPTSPVIDSWAKGVVPTVNQVKNLIEMSEHTCKSSNEELSEISSDVTPTDVMVKQQFDSSSTSLKLKSKRCSKNSNMNNKMRVISPPTVLEQSTSLIEKKSDEFSGSNSCTPFSSTALLSIPPLISDPQMSSNSQLTTETARLNIKKFPSPSVKPLVLLQNSEKSLSQPQPTTEPATRIWKSTNKRVKNQKHSIDKFPKPSASVHKHHKLNDGAHALGGMNRISNNRVLEKPTLPPFLDIIDPLPGVTVYENGQSVSGHISSRNKLWSSPTSTLHPITPIVKKAIYGKVASVD